MNSEAQELIGRCEGIRRGSGEAVDWVREVREGSQRLDRESDSLIAKLRRVRNLARRLGRTAARPFSVGFFGLSQAGKSYLISALAAGENGELETELDGERLNFIAHVNPPGHGKEATGLVTRFTRIPNDAPKGYPLELSLFSEVDLVKVMGNAFFNDFDRELVEFNTGPGYLRRHLGALEARRQPRATGGVDEDDVVELAEYFESRFPKTTEGLKADFWPTAVELAPYLEPADRGALFSILWGGIPDLTSTYLMLREALARTGFAQTLYCPLSALVTRDEAGLWTQTDSIMNVDILERLGRDQADAIRVLPVREDGPDQPVELARSLLAALTTELKFVLADAPKQDLLERVDLLDFPGYRGRLAVGNLAEVRKQLKDDQVDPVAQLVLRGKVAYLFERYTDDQEMNVLILCAPCHKQSDVKDLGPVLETWVNSTQGPDPAVRARRRPGLIWAVTMFDFRLNPVPGETEDLMRKGWDGMMKLALLERFGAYNWLHEWSPGRPFDNLFLVRKPRMATAVLDTRDGVEHGVLPEQSERLGLLRTTFCEDPAVRKHIQSPETAWDAMLALNDGGISRLAEYLGLVAQPEQKLKRIREQVDEITEELVRHRFGPYYRAEGAAEMDAKRRISERLIKALGRKPDRVGDLIEMLQPSRDHLRALYLRAEEGRVETGAGEIQTRNASDEGNVLIDLESLLDKSASDQDRPHAMDAAARFCRATLRDWVAQLKRLPEEPHPLAHLGLSREVLEDLVDELITGADRLGLESRLAELIRSAEEQATAKRTQLAERQVYAVHSRLARYLDYLGQADLSPDERPASTVDRHRPLFEPPPSIPPHRLPHLPERPVNFSGLYILDWFEALRHLIIDNAGHSAGREITPEQNARLGGILGVIEGRTESRAS
jgi:hypothetical protein